MNLLGLLGAQTAGVPGMPQVPDVASQLPTAAPINDALAANALKPNPQAQAQSQDGHGLFHPGGTIANILGALGDAFLVQSGHSPVYAPMMAERRKNEALKNYLGNLNPELAGLIGSGMDAGDAVAAYKITHDKPDQPGIAKEADYYRSIGRSDLADELLQRHAEGGPLIANNGDGTFTIVPQALVHGQSKPAGALPHVNTPEEAHGLPPGSQFIMPDGRIGTVPGGATASTPSPTFSAPINRVMDALTKQESSGNGTAVSPKGALGSTQLMPGTARQMASKLGLPFRADMLQSNTPQALAYQRQLATAYLQEGLDKTGSLTDALHYYHGGPDRSMWGPKTRAYATDVLARLGTR